MAKVIQFRKKTSKVMERPDVAFSSFTQEVNNNIDKLCGNLDVSKEEAIEIATKFYRAYPMLMEFVRSPDHLLRK